MLLLLSLALLMHNTKSDAETTCGIQSNCLHVDIQTQNEDTGEYTICLSWTSVQNRIDDIDSCGDMLSNWMADGDKLCVAVKGCGEQVSFDVPNGETESVTSDTASRKFQFIIDNEYASCKGDTNTLNTCTWTVSAPPCKDFHAFHAEESADNEERQGLTVLDDDGKVNSSMFIIFAAIFACVALSTMCAFIYCKVMDGRDKPIVKKVETTDVYLDEEQSVNEHQKEDEEVVVVTLTQTTT